MYPKRTRDGDGTFRGPLLTSDRLRRRPKLLKFKYYSPKIFPMICRSKKNKLGTNKLKSKTAASGTAKIANQPMRNSSNSISSSLVSTSIRRSTRKRRSPVNVEGFIDSSGSEDEDLMKPTIQTVENRSTPRREGLRPRHSQTVGNGQLNLQSSHEQDTSFDMIIEDETENGDETDDNEADGDQNDDDAQDEGDGGEDDDDEGDEDADDDEDEDEEEEGRRRYDLRNRADVCRHPIQVSEQRPRSPRRVLHRGIGRRGNRDVSRGGSRVHKRHRVTIYEDSDDSLLADELDQGPFIPWAGGGSRSGAPLLFGGLDMLGSSSLGLNAAASGWVHQGDTGYALSSGIQTGGPSSKGGADIQPLQVDESVSFDDIGGLSGYIAALKEMVFFPLLYPDFFASYHITPPRGVLLCGPPGTGKTLIARALACAASKAGQKVSFYMRKGADVLSKWVGEAERQLKLLFEEAQRNQPSIIFFDEIDGLAPVRSSKQEQIHNSIVSTLLALMDGLDSRGQVVLIGATNRIDAIDGALRRPGRFDREFNFPLPGCEARAEILDIHTRKWKHPPSKELKAELAANCVGYCGADLKALCTEAAIHAFREKYPQVYMSDDKFLIDVDAVRVEKYNFIEAMSMITPAAHRGTMVHSRPLPLVVAPCLQRHLQRAMNCISDMFAPFGMSSGFTKLAMLSHGCSIPLVYRPHFLLCGSEGSGLDHLGPAILHELEKFPVHSLGFPSLLSDPSAKTPEEALVHIFGEARRTAPSVLFVSQFGLWWENAHEQLRAVLLTLLEELPSDIPILLLGTSLHPPDENEDQLFQVFPQRSVYQVGTPSTEDRSLFFDRLIEAALSVLLEERTNKVQERAALPELPKAPKVASGPKASELKARIEAEQHALRRMRMCLRDVCNQVLYDKRFSAFHYPVTEEDAPNYGSIIKNPMDVATLLQSVDSGQYITCSAFLQDFDLIVTNAKVYNGDDYNGARIVSRAYELRDAVHGMLSQMDPALVAYCDKITEQGGPLDVPDDLAGSIILSTPVVQIGSVTRSSARLFNVQPEVNKDRSYEALKRLKKGSDVPQQEEKSPPTKASSPERKKTLSNENNRIGTEGSASQDTSMLDVEISRRAQHLRQLLVKKTENFGIPQLERLYTRIMKDVFQAKDNSGKDDPKVSVLKVLLKFAEDDSNF